MFQTTQYEDALTLMFQEALENIETCKEVAYLLVEYSHGSIALEDGSFTKTVRSPKYKHEELFELSETSPFRRDNREGYYRTLAMIKHIEEFVQKCEHVKIIKELSFIDFGTNPEERTQCYWDAIPEILDCREYGRFLEAIDRHNGFYDYEEGDFSKVISYKHILGDLKDVSTIAKIYEYFVKIDE